MVDMRHHFFERGASSVDKLVLREFAHAAVRTFETEHEIALHLVLGAIKFLPLDTLLADPLDFSAYEIDHPFDFFRPGGCIDRDSTNIRGPRKKRLARISNASL